MVGDWTKKRHKRQVACRAALSLASAGRLGPGASIPSSRFTTKHPPQRHTVILDKKFEETGLYHGKPDKYSNLFDAREELDRVPFKGRRMLWQDSCQRILNTFIFGPAAGAFNARNPIKLEELLEQPAIIELDQELPKPLRVFLNDIILRWIHLYRLGQGETDQLRPVTFLEEVHDLFPKKPRRKAGYE